MIVFNYQVESIWIDRKVLLTKSVETSYLTLKATRLVSGQRLSMTFWEEVCRAWRSCPNWRMKCLTWAKILLAMGTRLCRYSRKVRVAKVQLKSKRVPKRRNTELVRQSIRQIWVLKDDSCTAYDPVWRRRRLSTILSYLWIRRLNLAIIWTFKISHQNMIISSRLVGSKCKAKLLRRKNHKFQMICMNFTLKRN
jgi:hypothetical protein